MGDAKAVAYSDNDAMGAFHKYKKKSQLKTIWLRFKKNKLAVLGMILFFIMALLVIIAPLYIDYETVISQNMSERFQSPGSEHLLGTDAYGRDLLSRIIWGGRISLFVGLGTVAVSLTFGLVIGAISAYYGGKVDNVLMRFMDILLAVPSELMAIAVMAALGNSMWNLLFAIGLSQIPRMSRIVRSSVMSVKEVEYVEAARCCGAGTIRIIFRHIIPNAMGPILVQTVQTISRSVLSVASLSFIGLGVTEPTPEWGSMLSAAKAQMRYHAYLAIAPGVAIVLQVIALTLMGDGLRDAMDPRLKN